jgi:hypothetical protein
MNCKKFSLHFFELLDQKDDKSLNNDVSSHYEQCSSCKEAFDSLKKTYDSMQEINTARQEVSYFFTERTMSKIQSLRQGEVTLWQWISEVLFRKISVVSASFTAILAGVALGIFFNMNLRADIEKESFSDIQTFEEVYLAGTSNEYMMKFFENQNYRDDADEQK